MIKRFDTNQRMSQIVEYHATDMIICLAGQVSSDLTDDIKIQTKNVLEKIDGLLATAGSDKMNMISAQIWLADIATFDGMNAVWDNWVPAGQAPTRVCVEARLADPALKVEIQIICLKSRQ